MIRRIIGIVLAVVVLLALVVAVSLLFRSHKVATRNFAGATKVVVSVDAGSVVIAPSAADTVEVRRNESYLGRRPRVTEDVEGGTLRLQAHCQLALAACTIDYSLKVPQGLPVSVVTKAGAVKAGGLSGRLDLNSSAGNIDLSQLSGSVKAHSQAGAISGTGISSASFDGSTDAGAIGIGFSKAPRSLHLTTNAGNIDLRVPDEGYRLTTSAPATASVGIKTDPAAPRKIDARTAAGSIHIRAN